MAVPYTFGSATSSIPLSQLDSNFATTITLGNTAIQLGNTVTTLNNMTLANVSVTQATFTSNVVVSVTDNTNAALRITQLGTGNALLVEDSANPDSSPFVIDASGNVIVGYTATIAGSNSYIPPLQVSTGNTNNSGVGINAFSAGSGTGFLHLNRSKSNTIGTNALVSINDSLGVVRFSGADNTNYIASAEIRGQVDGTPGTNDMPGRLTFYTTADGDNSPTERMRIDSSGNLGVGTTSPNTRIQSTVGSNGSGAVVALRLQNVGTSAGDGAKILFTAGTSTNGAGISSTGVALDSADLRFDTGGSNERMRIDSSGRLLVGKTATNISTAGVEFEGNGYTAISRTNETPMSINRLGNDGVLIQFLQATTEEGTISVSGTTVSYNGGHLSRWAQMLTKPDLLKGTVMSNLDAMNVYTDVDGNPVENEQLNKVKVSDVEGDANVAGVFVNWTYDEAHQVDEINMAMTGDMIIRIAQGVTVQRGDLLMSAGDGTAKAQSDDIVRSKTIAKVTSTHVTCTYADGSYCVPCVLMAC
jgi:hypothetical protein